MLFSVQETGKNQQQPAPDIWGMSSVVTLFFAKKFLTKTDWCAGALS